MKIPILFTLLFVLCVAQIYSTPLIDAIEKGNTNKAIRLINRGVDIEVQDEKGWTPLHKAISSENTEVINALIEAGADVNAQSDSGITPLEIAEFNNNVDTTNTLIQKGADINIPDKNGWTVLHKAISNNNTEIINVLISPDNNADVNAQTNSGITPLEIAQFNNNKEIIEALINAGATEVKNLYYTTIIRASGQEEYWRPFRWETEIPEEYKISKVFVWETGNPNGKVEVTREVQHAFGWFRFSEAENAFGKYAILFENEKHDWDRRISIEIILE